ncbi:MAG: hypothetical protein IJL03_05435 [Lachnospiraceae bacterium]|nr:hypothetical protein [Lachnospiraceae bacterium]
MDTNTMIVLAAAGIIFLVVLLEFIFRVLYNKGTNALGNARRRHKNATQGPVIERLSDLYPEIAAQHQQNGTATAMNPALLQSDIPIIPATHTAKKQPGSILRAFASIIAGFGILINLYLLLMIGIHTAFPGWKDPEMAFASMTIQLLVAIGIMALIAYVVMIITRKPAYTAFFPIIGTASAVALMLGARWYFFDRGVQDLKKYLSWIGRRSGSASASPYIIPCICVAVALLLCYLLYWLCGWRWPLIPAVIISIALALILLFVIRKATFLADRLILLFGNYAGYALVALLYGLAEPKKAKKN